MGPRNSWLLVLAVASCTTSTPTESPPSSRDAGVSARGDAGVVPLDASANLDGGAVDAAHPSDAAVGDATPTHDANAPDATLPADASAVDAAGPDAALPDAHVPDANRPDAATSDAAVTPVDDAGRPALPSFCDTRTCAGTVDVMLQAFYWDVPVNALSKDGTWWDHLAGEAGALSSMGITSLWVPPPSKGNFGIYDMGYGTFDLYDLGNYQQKGTVETRFGSRQELLDMVAAMHARGIDVVVDIVLNHVYASDAELADNPAVRAYIENGATVDGVEYPLYPVSDVVWVVPDAAPGAWTFQVGGYRLPWDSAVEERTYRVDVWGGITDGTGVATWADETSSDPVMLGGDTPGLGFIETQQDEDAFSVEVTSPGRLEVRLSSRRLVGGVVEDGDGQRGYRIVAVSHDGVPADMQVHTRTGIRPVEHTGPGEANFEWSHEHFHPASAEDHLEWPGDEEVRPRWRLFGNDFNTFHPDVGERFRAWGAWLTDVVGFDGYRLDWVLGVPQDYVRGWLDAMPVTTRGAPRFAVAEYFARKKQRIREWVGAVDAAGTGDSNVAVFDFPLKFALSDMANRNGADFDMASLASAGMVRDPVDALPSERVVSFVENHDTGKERGYWLWRDWHMAYAFTLFAEERPFIYYPHLHGVQQRDVHDGSYTVQAPASLVDELQLLMAIRAEHLAGPMVVLSAEGNPYPPEDTRHVFVARREGPAAVGKTGAILVINNHDTETRGLWVDHAPDPALTSWSNRVVQDVRGGITTLHDVYADGRVYVSAPPRGYAVWMPVDEWDETVVP
ncbi:MAG: alpha-amylase family glycosyl hydrolase [Myxococcota bacterium]